jgi:vanillate O-demethylase ferredoxin subunit
MFDVIVSKRTQESERIISLELTAPNGGELPEFSAGAHIDVATPNGPVRQ